MIKVAALLVGLVCLAGCASSLQPDRPLPKSLQESNEVPGKSVVRQAAALRRDVLKNLNAFESSKYHCTDVTVVDTDLSTLKGDVLVDERGRLRSGEVTDRWVVNACGKHQELTLVYQPDGRGGDFVAIAENGK